MTEKKLRRIFNVIMIALVILSIVTVITISALAAAFAAAFLFATLDEKGKNRYDSWEKVPDLLKKRFGTVHTYFTSC